MSISSDDGSQIYVNNQYLTGFLGLSDFAGYGKTIYLEQGKTYPLKVLYQEFGGESEIALEWMRADANGNLDPYQREIIPPTALFH